MSGKSIRFLPMDENFQSLYGVHVGAESLGDGIDGDLFAQNSQWSFQREFIREIGDGRAVRLEIERQQRSVRRERAALFRRSIRNQRIEQLLGPLDRIRRKRK